VSHAPFIYRRTQVAWPFLVFATAIVVALVLTSLGDLTFDAIVPIGLLIAVPIALYGALTIRVDDTAVDVSFGLGFISRRIPLAQVRGWRVVHAGLRNGIGVRLISGGTLYNVTPGPAVELLLESGRVAWIGTAEPDRLMAAMARVHKPAVPDYPMVAVTVHRGWWRPAVRIAAIAILIFAVWNLWRIALQPDVTVSPDAILISAPPYRERIPIGLIRSVTLEDSFRGLRRWSDAFLYTEKVRGRFLLEGTGAATIFADRDRPPFVHIRTGGSYAIIGFRDPARTRALYQEILRAREGR
jgi:hypothetical protein